MSYFEESATLPPPFNIFPTPKLFLKLLGVRKRDKLRRMSSKRKERQEKERDYRYTAVMRSLVWRYVSAMHRQAEENPVTEDDISEVKGEISAMKCEILEVLQSNGMDISKADIKEKAILGKKMKIWERRLMKDFHVAPVTAEEEIEQLHEPPPENEDSLAKFRRIAKLAVLSSSSHKWGQVVEGVCAASQIGRCNNRESYKNQQNLQKAMDQARKLVNRSPTPGASRAPSPIPLPETTASTIMELLKDISEENDAGDPNKKQPKGNGGSGAVFLAVKSAQGSRATTPTSTLKPPKSSPITTEKEDPSKSSSSISTKEKQQPKTSTNNSTSSTDKADDGKDKKVSTSKSASLTPPYETGDDKHASKQESSKDKARNTDAPEDDASGHKITGSAVSADDPSPLIPTKRLDGDSPPKVIKRKAPTPIPGKTDETGKSPEQSTDSAAPYPKLPPPQQKSASSNVKEEVSEDHVMITIPEPSPDIKSESSRPTSQTQKQPPSVPTFQATLTDSENSTNINVSMQPEMVASSSREQLIVPSSPSPEPLRPVRRIADVNTVKRQPKGGWI